MDVEYLASLARIALSPDEKTRFTGQMEQILHHVEKLKTARTEGVEPTTHVLPLANVYREDRLRPSLSNEAALANAPEKDGPYFKVPRIIDPTT
jgi:aspartyl-tRNA(Asn)/glutamyl-tRNA(Gln) amidotransferase subunit C